MNSSEMLTLFRNETMDTVAPYLWSDAEVYAYMNDAYYMFVRLTGGIQDFNTDTVCKLTTVANQPTNRLHESLLTVRMASNDATGAEIKVVNAQDIPSLTTDDYNLIRTINVNKSVGRVTHAIIGMQHGYVRWAQIPDAVYNIRLLVERLPLDPIVGSGQEFEDVSVQHHYHLLKWMKHLAYNKQDSETLDQNRADKERKAFEDYCTFAKREKERYKHKTRVVAYGGL